ncbi:MAG: flagellar export chaperone FliS [Pirellulales bacterium]
MLGNDSNQYLEQDVMTASPARLRWLLLQKATSLSKLVRDLWHEERRDSALQWQLRLRDILNELLSGITGKDELAKQVSDLYIFMLTLLTKAEVAGEIKPLDDLHNLLEIELETWDLVQKQLSAAPRAAAMPTLSYGASSDSPLSSTEGSLCLDA